MNHGLTSIKHKCSLSPAQENNDGGRPDRGVKHGRHRPGRGLGDEVSSHPPRKPALISVPTRWKVPNKHHSDNNAHKCDLALFVVRPCPSSLLPSTVRSLQQRGRRPCHRCDIGPTCFCRGRNPTCRADCVAPCHETAGQDARPQSALVDDGRRVAREKEKRLLHRRHGGFFRCCRSHGALRLPRGVGAATYA